MPYRCADLYDLYDLENVEEYRRAASEVLKDPGLSNQQRASIQNTLATLPSRSVPTPTIGEMTAMFAGTIAGNERGSSHRFRVVDHYPNTVPQMHARCQPFETTFRNAVAAAVKCVNRYARVMQEIPFYWKAARLRDNRPAHLGLEIETRLPYDPTAGSRITYDGESVGLTLGVCAFSALTGAPIPVEFACTGVLSKDETVSSVNMTQTKIESLLIERPEATQILVGNCSGIVTLSETDERRGVLLRNDIRSLEQALDIIYENVGGCQGAASAFAQKAKDNALELWGSTIEATNGTPHQLLKCKLSGDNVDARILTALYSPPDLLQRLSLDKRLVIDGARASWLTVFLGARLANWASYVAARQTSRDDPDIGAGNAISFVGWTKNPSELGMKIVWKETQP